MTREFFKHRNLFFWILFAWFINQGSGGKIFASNYYYIVSDTILKDEVVLDSMTFFMLGENSEIQNTRKGTIVIEIDNQFYKIPYRLSAKAVVDLRSRSDHFKMTGLALRENSQLESYLKSLFRNPREKLKEYISPENWRNSQIYLQYFEPYDENSSNTVEKRRLNRGNESQENVFLNADSEGGIENYENFPLPETVDLEVDLRKNPKVLTVLGLEFNFDKLDKGFQELLMDYGRGKQKNRKSIPRND